MKKWQLQQAKNCFSQVVEESIKNGPQTITKRGKDTAVVLSIEDYRKLKQPEQNLVDFFQASPLKNVELKLDRDKSSTREINL